MAESKKSFVAYSDWHGMFRVLPDEVAGKLIKHIFSYVNDENPTTDDYVINALFEQIKSTLKRDLHKWESQKLQRSQAGKRSAEVRATKSNDRLISLNEKTRKATVSVNVSDSVNVNVSDNVINNKSNTVKFDFLNALIEQGTDPIIANEFIQVRKAKKAFNTETAFKALLREIKASKKDFGHIIQLCVESSWSGFKNAWLKNSNEPKKIQADLKKDITPSFRIMN